MSLQIAIVKPEAYKRKLEWGETVGGYKVYPCHKAQLDVLASKAKYTFACAGAQGGKTAIIPLWLSKMIAKNKGGRYLLVSPTVPMRKQSQIVEHVENCFRETIGGTYLKSDSAYRWDGGEILFRTADNPSSLDGGVYDGVAVDEAAKITLDAWQRIKVRGGAKDAPLLLVSTPDMASAIYDEVYGATKPVDAEGKTRASADGSYFMRVWTSVDRPGYSSKAFEDARRTMSPAMFDRMYRGVFSRLEGLVYEDWSDVTSPTYPVVPAITRLPSPALQIIGGGDFGFTNDPAAFLIGALCEDGIVYVLEEIYQTGLNNDQLAAKVIKMQDKWSVSGNLKFGELLGTGKPLFWCDREDPKAIDTLRKYGVNAKGYKVRDVHTGLKTTNAMFKAGRLKISASCVNLIEEARKYQWKQSRAGEYTEVPVDKDDHALSSLRYMVSSFMYGKSITPLELDQRKTAEELTAGDLEAATRLNLIDKGEDGVRLLEDLEAKQRNQILWDRMWADDSSVWQSN